ncbi:hypothetical protein [Mucilaginibacter flavidus]|uniref:hypothetical protein n=1 Tax=Mucilaginibacter flavidus TaxID=2949309 RepID=UPI0020922A38|nr:hypothetical protein [Mucilaginibacter flavidus]MCO5947237.1 hypothetical protein [Mucilaginibacter flavidus]
MKWLKKGLILDLSDQISLNTKFEFAQSPQTLVFEDFVRIYFSTRKKDIDSGKFLSFISFVDFDKKFERILNTSKDVVIALGGLGCFDEHGIFPINILRHDGKIYAYTCGWSRRVSVSVETSTGLAYSYDDGLTFQKVGTGPVLTSSLFEPMLVGDSFVRVYDGVFHMWYIFGKGWKDADENEPPARVYKIAHAVSKDGIEWKKEEGRQIISDSLNADECQALPTVLKIGDRYHMYFCYRQATDFRKNANRGYRLGYAFSDDLITWTRNDEGSGIEISETGWDSEMMCYPHIFECDGKQFLLYNGNEFGKHGFGIAELQQ